MLKLLASKLKELQPILVFIWAKILAVDQVRQWGLGFGRGCGNIQGCQSDLVKDGGYKYFISVLGDHTMQYEYRTMAAFILSAIVHNYPRGKVIICSHGNQCTYMVSRRCVFKIMSYQYAYHNWTNLMLCSSNGWPRVWVSYGRSMMQQDGVASGIVLMRN